MRNRLREDADSIIRASIAAVLPDQAVEDALKTYCFGVGRIRLVSVGKAAWQMAHAANRILGSRIEAGVVVTKYAHAKGSIANYQIIEAGHPVPDENSVRGAEAAMALTDGLEETDTVLFLLSGGGSALFESPRISLKQLQNLTQQLLACGADIGEINTIRKQISKVKGGKFAAHCAPAQVFSIILSDVLGDKVDEIASGPTVPNTSTAQDALHILKKYGIMEQPIIDCIPEAETITALGNTHTLITGSVRQLCDAAAQACADRGYEPFVLSNQLTCEAREAGSFLGSIARNYAQTEKPLAFIVGGETVVHLKGKGKGGRNQELALGAASGLNGLENCALFSIGSDGTDGPTDAAGGYVDGYTEQALHNADIDLYDILENNDAYHALDAVNGLIRTGSTGTNVNDVAVLLIQPYSI